MTIRWNRHMNRFVYKNNKPIHKLIAQKMGLTGSIKFKDDNPANCQRTNLYSPTIKNDLILSEEDKDLLNSAKWNTHYKKYQVNYKFIHKIIAKRMNLKGHIGFKDKNPANCQRNNLYQRNIPHSSKLLVSEEDKDLLEFSIHYESRWKRFRIRKTKELVHIVIAKRIGLIGRIGFKDNNPLNCQRNNLYEIRNKVTPLLSEQDKDLLELPFSFVNKKVRFSGRTREYLHKIVAERMGLKSYIGFKDGNPLNCQRSNLYEK